ncbi:siderophore-interacting protein [Deinococcus ficus]|uniref:siderophore-interacting protein n=1 Tax=Deinococcus ficus TaxID=317577 RepID=UPI0003B550A1|nr:siderophore-interacting protein [Deinococcus ficus]
MTPVSPTAQPDPARPPLLTEEAQDIMEHVNAGHVQELLHCVRAFTPVQGATHAQLTALFTDGMQLDVTTPAGTNRHFVPFAAPAPAHEAVRATVAAAMQKLGVKPDGRVAHWPVVHTRTLSTHFQRITVQLDEPLPWAPGYACRFDVPGQTHGRPYTLRRVHPHTLTAEIDVYCHDGTLGSRWAQGLEAGHTVTARGGRQESLPDFTAGPALLIGDETALPTIAALLETWKTPHPVHVLLEVGDAAEETYLEDVPLPPAAQVQWLRRAGASGDALQEALGALPLAPAAVWGALEVSRAKQLRKQLQAAHPGADVRIAGYWRVNEQH